MKRLFKKKKKSPSDASSLASGRSASGYNVSPKKDLPKLHKAAFENDIAKLKLLLKKGDVNQLDKENRLVFIITCVYMRLVAYPPTTRKRLSTIMSSLRRSGNLSTTPRWKILQSAFPSWSTTCGRKDIWAQNAL